MNRRPGLFLFFHGLPPWFSVDALRRLTVVLSFYEREGCLHFSFGNLFPLPPSPFWQISGAFPFELLF